MTERSAQSYEAEIARLEKALSDECANSLRLAQELEAVKRRAAVALVNAIDQGYSVPDDPEPDEPGRESVCQVN